MRWPELVAHLGRNDSKLVGRDQFLVTMFGYIFVVALLLRFVLPWLDGYLAAQGVLPSETFEMRLADTYPVFVAYIGLYVGALLPGAVFGFLLLDEKEDRTLVALRTTPLSMRRYLGYRIGISIAVAIPIVAGIIVIMGQGVPELWQLAVLAAGASLAAPIAMLFYAGFADDKVQGFAMTKFTGLAGWAIPLGWGLGEPYRWLAGLFPPYWISEAYWMALDGDPNWWGAFAIGFVLQVLLIAWLVRHMDRSTV